jgi:hypothetical protein
MQVDADKTAALFAAVLAGDVGRLRALLPPCGDPAEDGTPTAPGGVTPLMAAAAGGREAVVELLLRCGADPGAARRAGAPRRSTPARRGTRTLPSGSTPSSTWRRRCGELAPGARVKVRWARATAHPPRDPAGGAHHPSSPPHRSRRDAVPNETTPSDGQDRLAADVAATRLTDGRLRCPTRRRRERPGRQCVRLGLAGRLRGHAAHELLCPSGVQGRHRHQGNAE